MVASSAIDLRSDTVTRPSEAMRRVMLEAPVGDDVYGEDPSVGEFEARVAELCGKQAGLFCATGSLSNLLGIDSLVRPGTEVLCEASAHIARAEMGAHAALHGVTMRTWVASSGDGRVAGVASTSQIDELLAPDAGPYLVSTAAVEFENTHNFGGGTIQPIEHLREVSALCRSVGVGLHLDGARLWNAHVETGVPIAEYADLFDTVSLCFSKGLGAPVGSVLVGSAEAIAGARVQRKRLGAGWRQAGMLAAAAGHALDHNIDRLTDDHAAARAFAEQVALAAPGTVDPERVPTNIVVVATGARPAVEVVAAAAEQGVRLSAVGSRLVRAVTHLDVDREQCVAAGRVLGTLLAG